MVQTDSLHSWKARNSSDCVSAGRAWMPCAGSAHRPRDVLEEFPPELWLSVLAQLDVPTLLLCSTVCRAWHTLIQSSTHLQYTIELFADGLISNPSCPLTSAERLAQLLARRRAWATLTPTRRVAVRMSGRCHAYELVGGVFAKSMRLFEDVESPRRVVAARLPGMALGPHGSDHDGSSGKVTGRRIMDREMELPVRDFAIDPSQDLVALVHLPNSAGWDVHIHLNTISTNTRHPHAAHPVLSAPLSCPIDLACIQIVDDVLGFWFVGFAPGLLVWNWRTGEELVTSLGDLPEDYCDFSFLSPTSFVLTNASHMGSLDIFTFPSTYSGLPSHPLTDRLPTKAATLLLPALAPGVSLDSAYVHTGPFVARQADDAPFSTAPSSRIIAVSLLYRAGGRRPRRFSLFVHAKTLLRYMSEAPSEPTEWESWGPQYTRAVPQLSAFQWLRYVHGQRVVLPPLTIQDGPHAERVVRVLDFCVHPLRRDRHSHGEEHQRWFAPTTLDHECFVFREPLVTALPCVLREAQGREYRSFTGFMIDDQRLVGLRASAFSEEDMGDLDVFVF